MMHEGNAGSPAQDRSSADDTGTRRMAGLGRHVRRALGFTALALLSTASAPASAQWFTREVIIREIAPRESGVVTPGEVIRRLARRGYDEFTRPHFARDSYVVDATDRRGDRVRVVVDAYEGDIRRIRLLEEERLSGPARGRIGRYEERRGFSSLGGEDPLDALPRGRQATREEPPLRAPVPPAARPAQPSKPAIASKPRKPEAPAAPAASPAAPFAETARWSDPPENLGLAAPEPPAAPVIDAAPAAAKPHTEARAPVRVIEGVTPVIPQDGPKP